MNKLTAIILMLCLSCQLVLKLSIFAWFKINQDYIAATLCENKNKPELVCCGKCVLTKAMKKADDRESTTHKNTQGKAEQNATLLFILPSENRLPNFIDTVLFIKNPIIPNHHHFAYSQTVFHPPSV